MRLAQTFLGPIALAGMRAILRPESQRTCGVAEHAGTVRVPALQVQRKMGRYLTEHTGGASVLGSKALRWWMAATRWDLDH